MRDLRRPLPIASELGDRWWVRSRRDGPFPFEEVRDLLGIVRAYYRSTPRNEAARRRRIAVIGQELVRALREAELHPHGSAGHRAAKQSAEDACRELGNIVGAFDTAKVLVGAASAAITGMRHDFAKKRDER